jgi:hypothetical protein
MDYVLAFLLLVIIGVLVAIYRKIPTARSWEEQGAGMNAAHDEAVERADAVWDEFERIRQEPKWQDVIAEKVTEEAERRLRKKGVIS